MTFRTIQQQAIDRITGGHVMTERDAMLAAILSDPADDLPRLMYADWLDENGESERAEFVRVQVELSRRDNERDRCVTCVRSGEQHHNGPCRSPLKQSLRRAREMFGSVRHWIPDLLRGSLRGLSWGIDRYQMKTRHHAEPEDDERDIDLFYHRGFTSSARLSWVDWLRHHESLYWHPKQTVECPACWPDESGEIDTVEKTFGCECCGGSNNPFRRGTGRIPRPFVATAQPITEVELTTGPNLIPGATTTAELSEEITSFTTLDGIRFDRVKCHTCGGRGLVNATNGPIMAGDPIYQCPACRGQPLNKWYCDRWPTITFKMP